MEFLRQGDAWRLGAARHNLNKVTPGGDVGNLVYVRVGVFARFMSNASLQYPIESGGWFMCMVMLRYQDLLLHLLTSFMLP